MPRRTCWVEKCTGEATSWGMCVSHRTLWDALVRTPRSYIRGDLERFAHYVTKGASSEIQKTFGAKPDCWVWAGGLTGYGYGSFKSEWSKKTGRGIQAHIFAQVVVGGVRLLQNGESDHLCRFRPCVNPAHLEQVTQWENNRRGMSPPSENSRKTHCDEGHEFTPENTRIDDNGWRYCRECGRDRNREYTAKPEIKAKRLEKYVPSTGVRGKGQYQSVRDRCDEGHLLEGDNLIQEKRTRGGKVSYVRRCRTCVNAKARSNHTKRTGKA